MRILLLAPFLLAETAAEEAPAPAATVAAPEATAPDPAVPWPPGPPQDQALWRALGDTGNELVVERSKANKLLVRVQNAGYEARVAEAARSGTHGEPGRAGPLLRRLVAATRYEALAYNASETVNPRLGCRYSRASLAGAMGASQGVGAYPPLVSARAAAHICLEKLERGLGPLREANRELAAAVAEADAFLASAAPRSPSAAGAPRHLAADGGATAGSAVPSASNPSGGN